MRTLFGQVASRSRRNGRAEIFGVVLGLLAFGSVKLRSKETAADINGPVLEQNLAQIADDDQKYRLQLASGEKAYGRDSKQMRELSEKMRRADARNLTEVEAILDRNGWLGPEKIGADGARTLFLVIQHSNLETQKKYLPMMRDAVAHHRAIAMDLGYLEDRIATHEGRPQIYGSQVGYDQKTKQFYLMPVEDPEHLDQRRAAVGLGPIATYLANWKLTWDLQAYKADLPRLVELAQAGMKSQ